MLAHPKISPLIPTTITLSSSYNHQDFLCRSPKFPFRFNLNSLLEYQEDQLLPKIKEQKIILKIFKGLKRIKKIHQDDLVFHKVALPASKTKYLIKKVRRIEVLDIQDRLTGAKESPARLDLWLKHGKSLKNINYQFVSQILTLDKSVVLFEREIQQCLKFLPQHRSLTALKIRLANGSRNVLESLLQFPKYPQSLKNLAIYQQRTADLYLINADVMVSAFSRLKSLESLTLSGQNLLKVTEMLLGKVPSLLNLKKLNVQVFQSKLFGPMFDLNKCRTLQNLLHLKISNIAEGKNLSKLTNPPRLESFDIAAGIGVDGLGLISQFISLFKKSLKSLKFDILHSYRAETEQKIKDLFSEISQLEVLTSFKFKVKNMFSAKAFLSPGVIENLKGLFLKSVKLESFEWEVPQISEPAILLELLKHLEGSCGTLRKLKIFHLSKNLEKSQETWLFNFLQRLEKIEVLYLTDLHIQEESLWVGLVGFLKKLKSLKALGIGSVNQGFSEEWFTKPLGKILQKRGLEVLEIESSSTAELEVMKESLDLKEIMKVNPALKKVSRNVRELLNTDGFE